MSFINTVPPLDRDASNLGGHLKYIDHVSLSTKGGSIDFDHYAGNDKLYVVLGVIYITSTTRYPIFAICHPKPGEINGDNIGTHANKFALSVDSNLHIVFTLGSQYTYADAWLYQVTT